VRSFFPGNGFRTDRDVAFSDMGDTARHIC
jgi:hypothetical protein